MVPSDANPPANDQNTERKIPVNVYAQFLYNAERPSFVTNWSARFQIQFLFPEKKGGH